VRVWLGADDSDFKREDEQLVTNRGDLAAFCPNLEKLDG
jgi:hypothetical protein